MPGIFIFLMGMGWRTGAQDLYLGTKTPYVPPHVPYTPAPAGYRPVFVNYVGRHGARFLTKGGTDTHVLEILDAAARSHSLTDTGERVRVMVERLVGLEKGKYERISLLGAEEQRAIGERVLYNYKDAFTGRGLDVQVTYKVRTQQSADAFLHSYGGWYTGARRWMRTADSLDAILRFYDLSPGYQRYKKGVVLKRAMDSLVRDGRTRAAAEEVGSRIFRASFRAGWKEGEEVAFADELYDLYSVQFSLSGEMAERGYTKDSIDLGLAFSRKALAWEDFRSGAQDFLEKGPAADPLGIQVKVAAPLLADLVRVMDRAVGGGGPDAVLRFTHAEAIAPFAALLGIPSASVGCGSVYQYADHWQAAEVIPLSANIQWILYGNGKDWLVKVLLNEREVRLPLGETAGRVPAESKGAGVTGPYYKWEELRAYCMGRLQKVNAGLQEDMLGYLRGLR
ncbi:MAG TPA: hypothetical protein VGM30_07330 [Puia sp.]